MEPLTLLETLRERGADVRADGELLRIKPSGVSRDLALEIRAHKTALLELVSTPAQHSHSKNATDCDTPVIYPREIETATHRKFEGVGAAYAPTAASECPDGFIAVTRANISEVVTHCAKKQREKEIVQKEMAA
jgi:hypothetical protein